MLGGVVDGAGRNARLVEQFLHLLQRQGGGPCADKIVELGLPGLASLGGVERGVLGEVLAADGPHEPLEDLGRVAADDHLESVGAGVGTHRDDPGQGTTRAAAHHAVGVVLGHQRLEETEHSLVEADVDGPGAALDAAGALEHEHQRADHAVETGDGVGHAGGRAGGRAVRLTGEVAQAGEGLGGAAEAGAVAVGAGLPVAGDAHQDRVRVQPADDLGTDALAFDGAGAEVLDDHVGGGDQAFDGLDALRGPQVEDD